MTPRIAQYAANGSRTGHQALLDAGFPSGSEPIWEYSYRAFWDNFQRILREELDPTYDGDVLVWCLVNRLIAM